MDTFLMYSCDQPTANAEFLEWLNHFVRAMARDGIAVTDRPAMGAAVSRPTTPVLTLARQPD